MNKTIAITASLLLAACSGAKNSSEVVSSYVPSSTYQHLSCNQLMQEAEILRARTPELARAVDAHRDKQDGVELVTWILFWPAAFALDDGSEMSHELGRVRGQLEAIQQNIRTRCN